MGTPSLDDAIISFPYANNRAIYHPVEISSRVLLLPVYSLLCPKAMNKVSAYIRREHRYHQSQESPKGGRLYPLQSWLPEVSERKNEPTDYEKDEDAICTFCGEHQRR